MHEIKDKLLSIKDVCELLDITRQTLYTLCESHGLKPIHIGRKVRFRESDVLSKFGISHEENRSNFKHSQGSFCLLDYTTFKELKADQDIFDLSKIIRIDSHGLMSLLGCILFAESSPYSKIIINNSRIATFLNGADFFNQLKNLAPHSFEIKETRAKEKRKKAHSLEPTIILPLTKVGYKGGERKVAEDLSKSLIKLGYSKDLAAYASWAIGELADNSLTHARKPFCFIMVQALEVEPERAIQITVGDIGVGVSHALKSNVTYSKLSDSIALFLAFKSKVSGWPDEAKRGKGLTDVLKIVMANQSTIRIDSGLYGYVLDFRDSKRSVVQRILPMANEVGTIVSLMLYDRIFTPYERVVADTFIEKEMGHL